MISRFSTLSLGIAALAALVVVSGCGSAESPDRPGSATGWYGSGQPDQEAATSWVTRVGYRNQKGELGDRYGRQAPAPEPAKPAPPALPPAKQLPPPTMDMSRCTMAFPTGDRASSVILLECLTPAEVRVGAPYDYEMRVTNLTNMNIEDVTVTDMMQGNYAMSGSNPPAASNTGGTAVWTLGRFGPGETKVIKATGMAQGAGAVTRCTKVTYNSQCCVTTRVVSPALQIKKTAPAEVLACDPIEIGLTVTNSGSGMARNVQIVDTLPQGWTAHGGGNTITIDAGNLDSGQSKDFKVRVNAGGVGRYDNTAMAKAEGGLEAKSNTTTTVVKNCALTITKTARPTQVIGRDIDYEITVTNKGDGEARDVMLDDMLPAGTRFVRASDGGAEAGGKVSWRLGTMAPGASKKVTCSVNAVTGGSFKNTATARAYCCPPASADAVTVVQGVPAILLEVVDDPDPIEIGKEVGYTITVTNQGTAPDSNIVIKVDLEAQEGFVSAGGATAVAGTAPAASGGGGFTFAPLATLAPKQKAVWTVRCKALAVADVRFKVSMTSSVTTRSVDETESTHFY